MKGKVEQKETKKKDLHLINFILIKPFEKIFANATYSLSSFFKTNFIECWEGSGKIFMKGYFNNNFCFTDDSHIEGNHITILPYSHNDLLCKSTDWFLYHGNIGR